jgi:hypothetical protein
LSDRKNEIYRCKISCHKTKVIEQTNGIGTKGKKAMRETETWNEGNAEE